MLCVIKCYGPVFDDSFGQSVMCYKVFHIRYLLLSNLIGFKIKVKVNLKIIKLNILLTNKNNYLIIFGDPGKKVHFDFRI